MNYEKKYKEALETVQEILNSGIDAIRIKTLKLRLQSGFPELLENKEERIKREILELVSIAGNGNQYEEIKDWLETKEWSNEDEYLLKETIEHLEELIRIDKKHFSGHDVLYYKRDIDWLKSLKFKKQGEGKSNPYSGTSFEYNGHIWGMCARDNGVDILLDNQLFKHLEKQGEKSTTIDIDKMVFEYSTTEDGDLGFPINCMIRAYRKGIEDVLKQGYCALKRNEQTQLDYEHADIPQKDFAPIEQKTLNADEVIEWMKTHGNLFPIVTIRINDVIAKFKKDFGLC